MAGRNEWRVVSTTGNELEQRLNAAEGDGWDVAFLFPPEDSNSQFFTLVLKRGAQAAKGGSSRSMDFGKQSGS
jgi:hypothetical protein